MTPFTRSPATARPEAERIRAQRAAAKRVRKDRWALALTVILAMVLGLMLSGCACTGIQASEIEGTLNRVLDRHDEYVNLDPRYDSEEDRQDDLRDSAVLREALNAGLEAE